LGKATSNSYIACQADLGVVRLGYACNQPCGHFRSQRIIKWLHVD